MSLAGCDGDPGHCSPLCSLIEKSCLMSDHLDQTIRPADTQPRLGPLHWPGLCCLGKWFIGLNTGKSDGSVANIGGRKR